MIQSNLASVGISTFTYFGRHVYGIGRFIKHLPLPEKIVCLGSGVLEPFLFSEQILFNFPNSSTVIEAVDCELVFIDLIQRLLSGEKIKVSDFAILCCDSTSNGEDIINTNFLHRFNLGVKEWSEFGLNPYKLISYDHSYFIYTSQNNHLIKAIHWDAKAYLQDKRLNYPRTVDLIYSGSLFINLLKKNPVQYIEEMIDMIYEILHEFGTLCVCTSPVNIHEKHDELHSLINSQFYLSLIIVENIIVENKKIAGDYMILLNKTKNYNDEFLSKMMIEIKLLFQTMSSNMFIKSLGYKLTTIHKSEFLSKLLDSDELLICALQMPDDFYLLCLVNRQNIIDNNFFNERRNLNYSQFI